MVVVSYKNPRNRRLIYLKVNSEKEAPKEINRGGKVYILYGVHTNASDGKETL